MRTITVLYIRPDFPTWQLSHWLKYEVSPGDRGPYYYSSVAEICKYRSDDKTSWHIEVSFKETVTVVVDLPENYYEELIKNFGKPDETSISPELNNNQSLINMILLNNRLRDENKDGKTRDTEQRLDSNASEQTLFRLLRKDDVEATDPSPPSSTTTSSTEPIVLLEREDTGFCSTHTEYLCLEPLSTGEWRLGVYQQQCLSPENIPQEILFPNFAPENEDDEPDWDDIELPIAWQGHNITAIIDDGLLTDELILMDKGVKFSKESLRNALKYCKSKNWHEEDGFEDAWLELMRTIGVIG